MEISQPKQNSSQKNNPNNNKSTLIIYDNNNVVDNTSDAQTLQEAPTMQDLVFTKQTAADVSPDYDLCGSNNSYHFSGMEEVDASEDEGDKSSTPKDVYMSNVFS